MNKKILVISAVLIVLAGGLIFGQRFFFTNKGQSYSSSSKENAGSDQNAIQNNNAYPLSDEEIATLSEQVNQEFDYAFTKAREWRDDSVLIAKLIRYKGSIKTALGSNTYVFLSPSMAEYYWTIEIDQDKNTEGDSNYRRAIYYKEDYFLDPATVAVPLKYMKLSYLDALKEADKAGGDKIRSMGKSYDANILLSALKDRYLSWKVEYVIDNEAAFSYEIDANSGKKM